MFKPGEGSSKPKSLKGVTLTERQEIVGCREDPAETKGEKVKIPSRYAVPALATQGLSPVSGATED